MNITGSLATWLGPTTFIFLWWNASLRISSKLKTFHNFVQGKACLLIPEPLTINVLVTTKDCASETTTCTALKVSVSGVILVYIFPHSDWIRLDRDHSNSEYGHFLRSVDHKVWRKLALSKIQLIHCFLYYAFYRTLKILITMLWQFKN